MSYRQSAEIYDAIFEGRKDYKSECRQIHEIIQRRKTSPGNRLLDIGCGTGLHDQYFAEHYEVEGLDSSPEMLRAAADRLPLNRFHEADMRSYSLDKTYDVIVSLFSAIGHLLELDDVYAAVARIRDHLAPGGVVVVEPWFVEGAWKIKPLEVNFLPHKSIVRIVESSLAGNVAELTEHFFVGWPGSVRYFCEKQSLAVRPLIEYQEAFEAVALKVDYDSFGLTGRGLLVATSKE